MPTIFYLNSYKRHMHLTGILFQLNIEREKTDKIINNKHIISFNGH